MTDADNDDQEKKHPFLNEEFMEAHQALVQKFKCMLLPEIDGLLTAIAITPEKIRPKEWLSVIFRNKKPRYESKKQGKLFLAALNEHLSNIKNTLDTDPEAHGPILSRNNNEEIEYGTWALGFILGVDLRLDTWRELFQPDLEGPEPPSDVAAAMFFYRVLQSQLREAATGKYTFGEEKFHEVRTKLRSVRNPFTAEVIICNNYWKNKKA